MHDARQILDRELNRGMLDHEFEVLNRAVQWNSVCCPNCNYPENSLLYSMILSNYTYYKRKLHPYRQKCDMCDMYDMPESMRNDINQILSSIRQCRDILDTIRPCADCHERYNPNNRKTHGMSVNPKTVMKGLIDE